MVLILGVFMALITLFSLIVLISILIDTEVQYKTEMLLITAVATAFLFTLTSSLFITENVREARFEIARLTSQKEQAEKSLRKLEKEISELQEDFTEVEKELLYKIAEGEGVELVKNYPNLQSAELLKERIEFSKELENKILEMENKIIDNQAYIDYKKEYFPGNLFLD